MINFFNHYFVDTFTTLIQVLANLFQGSYGLSIIMITLLIRLALLPIMLKQSKKQHAFKEKLNVLKPEMDAIQERLKSEKNPEKQKAIQLELMNLFTKHGVNPLSSMGCLPILIQMPILMGFYFAISRSEEIASHSFLWFNLGQADLILTFMAGLIYYGQALVSQRLLPSEQQKQMKLLVYISPILIVVVSLTAPAALPLYWSVSGLFLLVQLFLTQRLLNKPQVESQGKKDEPINQV